MDDDAECGSRNVVEFVARDRDRATRALSPRARRATCAASRAPRDVRAARAHDSIRPSASGASLGARDAGALVFMVFRVLFTRSFGSLQYDHVDTQY